MDSDNDEFEMLVGGTPYDPHNDDTKAKEDKSKCR